MVDRQEVIDVADELHRRGHKPTVRRVIGLLDKGGSPNDVAPLLKDWRENQIERHVSQRPPALDDHLQDFISKVWVAAQAEARSKGDMCAKGAEKLQALTDGQLIALETEIAGKDILIESMRQELARVHDMLSRERDERLKTQELLLREKDRKAEPEMRDLNVSSPQLTEVRRADLWDRIGAAATEIIRHSNEPISTPEIINSIPVELKDEYELKFRKLDARPLRKWLDRRAAKKIDIVVEKNLLEKKYRYIQ